MIRIGPFSATHLESIKIRPTALDYILLGISILLCLSLWGLAFFFQGWLPKELDHSELFRIAAVGTIIMLVAGGMTNFVSPCSFTYPVRVHKENLAIQYLLVLRFLRIVTILAGLLMALALFNSVEVFLPVGSGLFNMLIAATVILLVLTMVVYYLIARKYR